MRSKLYIWNITGDWEKKSQQHILVNQINIYQVIVLCVSLPHRKRIRAYFEYTHTYTHLYKCSRINIREDNHQTHGLLNLKRLEWREFLRINWVKQYILLNFFCWLPIYVMHNTKTKKFPLYPWANSISVEGCKYLSNKKKNLKIQENSSNKKYNSPNIFFIRVSVIAEGAELCPPNFNGD